MLHFADTRLASRQNLATGRMSERITRRGLTADSATLTAQVGAGPRLALAARFLTRREGYFAFSILPARDMPDFSAAPNVKLRAEFHRAAGAPIVAERTVAGSALALKETTRKVDGQDVTLRTVSGAPIDLSVEVDPAPVALQGIVLRQHDPADPAKNVTVEAGPASTVTDDQGRFFFAALPLLDQVSLKLTDNGAVTNLALRIDYSRPVNTATLSLPN